MNIYLILLNNPDKKKSVKLDFINLTERIFDESANDQLRANHNVIMKRSGIKLSPFELTLYYRHYIAWKHFWDSGQEYCLILENVEDILKNKEEICCFLKNKGSDWDILFPYDGFEYQKEKDDTFLFGFRWGTHAYFLRRAATPILLKSTEVSLPIDEQILTLARDGELSINYEATDLFVYGNTTKYLLDKNKTKLNTILTTNIWVEKDKKTARNLIERLSNLLIKNNLDFFISEGTLLGHIRHGKIMDWDDDIDFSLNIESLNVFLNIIKNVKDLEFTEWRWQRTESKYYKVWSKSSHDSSNSNRLYGFPFIDIWLFEKLENTIKYNHGDEYSNDCIYPLLYTKFEGSLVKIPQNPLKYLDLKYSEWRKKIVVFPWGHKNDSPSLFPLTANIKTHSDGRMVIDHNEASYNI